MSGSSSQDNKQTQAAAPDLTHLLSQKVVGQSAATKAIVPYVYMHQSGLAPEGRPAGVFLLLGPTGTGKTKTVEAVAELLHGSEKKIVRIDCGEFQMEHEVAKLIGAPPGYLGHRETVPMLTQESLAEATSVGSDLALVLFDEIEKAAPSMTKLLLGILDKGTLRLGDNTTVDFEKSLIFFTSNLGAREMMKQINPDIGFQAASPRAKDDLETKLESIALGAVRRRFSPEFVNRIDAVVTYQPLDNDALQRILDYDISRLQAHVNSRLGENCFTVDVTPEARQFLLNKGFSETYGARELKRTIHRELTQPLATMVAACKVPPGSKAQVTVNDNDSGLTITAHGGTQRAPTRPRLLIVDDNHDLVWFLAKSIGGEGWQVTTAESSDEARILFKTAKPTAVLVDYMLGDEDGLRLASEFQAEAPATQIMMMTGGGLSDEELIVCRQKGYPILFKPFMPEEVIKLVRSRNRQTMTAGSG